MERGVLMTDLETKAMFCLMQRALGQDAPFAYTLGEDSLFTIYEAAQKHDLAHLLFSGMAGLKLSEDAQLLFKIRKKHLLAAGRQAQKEYETERILALLEEKEICHDHLPKH